MFNTNIKTDSDSSQIINIYFKYIYSLNNKILNKFVLLFIFIISTSSLFSAELSYFSYDSLRNQFPLKADYNKIYQVTDKFIEFYSSFANSKSINAKMENGKVKIYNKLLAPYTNDSVNMAMPSVLDKDGNQWINLILPASKPDSIYDIKINGKDTCFINKSVIFRSIHSKSVFDTNFLLGRVYRNVLSPKKEIFAYAVTMNTHYTFLAKYENEKWQQVTDFIPSNCSIVINNNDEIIIASDTVISRYNRDLTIDTLFCTRELAMQTGYLFNLFVLKYDSKQDTYYCFTKSDDLLIGKNGKWTLDKNFSERLMTIPRGELLSMELDSKANIYFLYRNLDSLIKRTTDGNIETIPIKKVYLYSFIIDNIDRVWIQGYSGSPDYKDGCYIYDPKTSSVEEYYGWPVLEFESIYPNPAKENVRVELFAIYQYNKNLKIELYNSLGIKVKDLKEFYTYNPSSGAGVCQFSIADLTNGFYYVCINSKNISRAKGLIIAK